MQPYASDPSAYDDPDTTMTAGHYIVAIGYDVEDFFYFHGTHPWSASGAYLSRPDLDKRWHRE